MDKIRQIEAGVYEVPFSVSASLMSCKEKLKVQLLNAQRRLRNFAREYHWEKHVEKCFMNRAKIFDTQEKFIQELIKLLQLTEDFELPKTVSACLENGIFMAISPELYKAIYPQGFETDFYEKLITHELAHRLHIRILNGNEEKMGPIWFFEGFALFAAEQFCEDKQEPENLKDILLSSKRGSYQEYARVFRYLIEKYSLKELVKKAGEENFTHWLINDLKL